MGSVQVSVTIRRPLDAVFAVYTDETTWYWWSLARRVEWTSGKPWNFDSRMRIETVNPANGPIDQVLTRFEPMTQVGFISHFAGVTLQSRHTFRAVSERETEIRSQVEFVGVFSRIAGFAVGPAVERHSREFFADLKRECEARSGPADTQEARP